MNRFALLFCCAALAGCDAFHETDGAAGGVYTGNVDDRQLNVAFVLSERLAELLPEEGTRVKKGETIARLETARIEREVAAAQADVAAREASVAVARAAHEKSENGSRAEDIAIARAVRQAILARFTAAETDAKRMDELIKTHAVSEQKRDNAEADYRMYGAAAEAIAHQIEKLLAGDRAEDRAAAAARLAEAEAAVAQARANLAILEQKLADTVLAAPCDGVVRERLLEPGEMTSPQMPVLTLAVTSPKWVRIYLAETDLTSRAVGAKASVTFDGFDGAFDGWLGFVSPTAEYTPKTVETRELRASLVYEARVFVNDPENRLKQGAPATVTFAP